MQSSENEKMLLKRLEHAPIVLRLISIESFSWMNKPGLTVDSCAVVTAPHRTSFFDSTLVSKDH